MKPVRNSRLRYCLKNSLAIATLLLPLFSVAQLSHSKLRLGITGSANLGWMVPAVKDPEFKNNGFEPGYSFGILADYGDSENYYFFSSGVLLTQMVADVNVISYNDDEPLPAEKVIYKIRYVQVPLTVKFTSDGDSGVRLYGQFGPDVGMKVSFSHSYNANYVPNDPKTLRVGVLISGGAEWKIRHSSVLAGFTFERGSGRVFKKPEVDVKNRLIALNVGLFF